VNEVLAAGFLLLGLVACLSPLYLAIRARRRLWIALGAIWLLLSVVPLMAFAIPEVTYWATWARCGNQPAGLAQLAISRRVSHNVAEVGAGRRWSPSSAR
jgi:hypothetical protein